MNSQRSDREMVELEETTDMLAAIRRRMEISGIEQGEGS